MKRNKRKKAINQPQSEADKEQEERSKKQEIIGEKPSTIKFHHILSISLILLISISIYSNTLKNGFVYDDESTIVKNTLIKNLDNLSKLFKIEYFIVSGEMSYRPVVTFTYFIEYALYGLKPFGYHLTNLILHTINGVILYIFLTLLFIQPSQSSIFNRQYSIFNFFSSPLLISLIFVTHPVLTEAVNAISFREDLLCFLFFVSALILYITYRSSLIAHSSKFKAFSLQLLSLSFYLLALLSKEMAITLPIILFLYEWIYSPYSPLIKGDSRGLFKRVRGLLINPYIIGYIAITFFYLYLRFYLFHNPYEEVVQTLTLSERLMTIPYLILKYLILLIAPVSLSTDYVITPIKSFVSPLFLISMSVIILLSFIIYKLASCFSPLPTGERDGVRGILFGILFLLLTLLPVYNIIPIANPFAERYLYLPMVGFTIAIGSTLIWLMAHIPFKNITGQGSWFLSHRSLLIAYCLLLIIISIYSFTVIKRNKIWLDDYSLWSDTVIKMPNSSRSHNSLGIIYESQGRLEEAVKEYKMALTLEPDYEEPYNNLGNVYSNQGQLDEAIKNYLIAIKNKPNFAEAYNNLGFAYYKQGQLDEAIKNYLIAIKNKPNFAEAYDNLGNIYLNLGRIDEAIKNCLIAIKFNPDLPEPYGNLGLIYDKLGKIDEAIKAYLTFIKLNPDDADAHYFLALTYDKKGLRDEAIAELETALELKPDFTVARQSLEAISNKGRLDETIKRDSMALTSIPDNEIAHFNLGKEYLDKGMYDEAIREYLTAVRLKPDFAEAYNNLGFVYSKQGKFDEAIKEYLTAIRIKPEFAEAYNNLGLAYNRLGQIDETIKAYLTLLKLKPEDAVAHYNLAGFYNKKGLRDEVIKELEITLKLKPDFAPARQKLEAIRNKDLIGRR